MDSGTVEVRRFETEVLYQDRPTLRLGGLAQRDEGAAGICLCDKGRQGPPTKTSGRSVTVAVLVGRIPGEGQIKKVTATV